MNKSLNGTESYADFVAPANESHPRFEPIEDDVILQDRWGDVIAGFDLKTGAGVSITRIDVATIGDDAAQSDFWHRARHSLDLNSPHILRVHEIDESRRWIITDPITAKWSPRSKQRAAASPMDSGQVLRRLLAGLDHVHSMGYFAETIGPDDLCLQENGEIVLRCLAPMSASGTPPLGRRLTLPFAAPEQFDALTDTSQLAVADIYSLGVAVCERLVGEDLHKMARLGSTPEAVDWKAFATSLQSWDRIERYSPKLSEPIAKVINRMIRKLPTARYTTAEAAIAELDGGVAESNQTAVTADQPSPPRKNVIMQRSPLSKDIRGSHFKPINPVEADRETKIEKFLSPEQIFAWIRKPAISAMLFLAVAAFFLLNWRPHNAAPIHMVSLKIVDAKLQPINNATLSVKRVSGGYNASYNVDSEMTAKVPQGTYDLSVSKRGYVEETTTEDIFADTSSPIVFTLSEELIPDEPLDVTICPQVPNSSDEEVNFDFYEIDSVGASDKRLIFRGLVYSLELPAGATRQFLIRAVGYKDELAVASYASLKKREELEVDLCPILQPDRSLIIQIEQTKTAAWVLNRDGWTILRRQRKQPSSSATMVDAWGQAARNADRFATQTPRLGDVYIAPIGHNESKLTVKIACDGYEDEIADIEIPAGKVDHTFPLTLTAMQRPMDPIRTIESRRPGTRVTVVGRNGEAVSDAFRTPCEIPLADGTHVVRLQHDNGPTRDFHVMFNPFRNWIKFDF